MGKFSEMADEVLFTKKDISILSQNDILNVHKQYCNDTCDKYRAGVQTTECDYYSYSLHRYTWV